jgi:glycerophosphoryl diester phosphodiesterase
MRILAHRGASGYAPENTFAAFDLALKLHADAIETDVRMTRDGVVVLIHDEKVDRTTTGAGFVHELSWQEIESFDAGVRFAEKFAGQRIPRASDFLHHFAARVPVCLEVKTTAAVEPLLCLFESNGGIDDDRLEFTSFEWKIIQRLHTSAPRARIGFLTRAFTHDLIDQVRLQGLTRICPPAKDVTVELVDHCHRLGVSVRTWGAKTREVLQHIIDCGVDGTTLNHPDWIRRENGRVSVAPQLTIAHENPAGAEL